MTLWVNQQRSLDATVDHVNRGIRHWCVVSPTASGKSRTMQEEIKRAYGQGMRVSIYSYRKILTNQLIGYLEELEIPFGVRAAEFEEHFHNHTAAVQLISPQTESSRMKRMEWQLHDSDIVIVDEAHMLTKGEARRIIREHEQSGEIVIEYTATPTKELRRECPNLFIAATNSEMRKVGALLPAFVYDGGCANLDKIKRHATTGEFNNKDLKSRGYVQAIIGKVIENMERLNPEMQPTMVTWPGVAEALWGTDQFAKRGHRFAAITADQVYVDGKSYDAKASTVNEIVERVKDGNILGLCHRFKLREAFNLPSLYCGILATPIGSFTSYVQTVGRMLRASPGMDHVRIIDHGGNARRHGSPNEDWDWEELSQMTNAQIEQTRKLRQQSGKIDAGTACPNCGKMYRRIPDQCECGYVMKKEYACPICGHEHRTWPIGHKCEKCAADMRSIRRRPVIQEDGTMQLVPDEELREKPTRSLGQKTEGMWAGIFWAARNKRKSRTFAQCFAYFVHQHIREYHCRPPRDLKLMPKRESDWSRRPCDVDLSDLIGHESRAVRQDMEMQLAVSEGW